MPPATVPGLGSGEETALSAAARPAAEADAQRAADAEPAADAAEVAAQRDGGGADARFDAARERLRAQIQPPEPPDDD